MDPNVICIRCGKQFHKKPSQIKRSPRHFCSRSCAASTNNLGVQRNKPKINKPRRLSRATKSEELKKKTIADYQSRLSVAGKHCSWANSHIRDFNRSWNRKLRLIGCQVCGYAKHVELAHIKAVTSFDKDTPLGVVNHPTNILVLCPNHHWEYDSGLLNLSDIPARPES